MADIHLTYKSDIAIIILSINEIIFFFYLLLLAKSAGISSHNSFLQ